jgi:predicted dehydrogenase
MRLALIGASGHWREYVPTLQDLPDVHIVAVAPGEEGESLARFDGAPGVDGGTFRHAHYRDLLAAGGVDAVQVCVRPHLTAALAEEVLLAGFPVMADKPLAMNEAELGRIWAAQQKTGALLSATHMYRRLPNFALAGDLVRNGTAGEIVAGFCQISFRWGASRPDWCRWRETFPGTFSFIGVHAVDTVFAAIGDRFRSASGHQSTTPHPDYPACASLAYASVTLDTGGILILSADFLRPMGASTHGDVRLRLAGTKATLDATDHDENSVAVVDEKDDHVLPAPPIPYWYTTFAEAVMGTGKPFMTSREALRIAEITLRIQRALDTGDTVDLTASALPAY